MSVHDEEAVPMDDQTHPTNDDTHENGKGGTRETADAVVTNLRTVAGDLAERAGPTVREVSARAAELTAIGAGKAAPLAKRAGEVTADASTRLAEIARGWAAELRSGEKPDADASAVATGDDLEPSDLAVHEAPVADASPVADAPASFESTVADDAPSPAFEEDGGTPDDRESHTPGI
jgi:hypothetical protein